MKPIYMIAMAVSLCIMPQVQAGEVFTVLDTVAESRQYLDVVGNDKDSWGALAADDETSGRLLVNFHRNDDGSVTHKPYPNSLIADLKPKGDEQTLSAKSHEGYIEQVWPLRDGNVLFSTDTYTGGYSYLYKLNVKTGTVGNNAPDYDNRQAVMNMGESESGPQPDIRALHHRSLLETKADGKPSVLYYGEYNASDSNSVALWKSLNGGDTWSKVIEWNAQGHQTRHIHAVVQNPFNDWIYLLFGDSEEESGIVAWDGVSEPPPDNTALVDMGNYPGWKSLTGSKRVRAGDLVFTPPPSAKCVWLPDTDNLNAGEKLFGQRANYDLSELEETGEVPYSDGISPILAARSNTGNIYWSSYRNQNSAEQKIHIWKSIDAGLNWMLAGKVDVYTDWTAIPQNLWVHGDTMESVTTDYLTINGRDLEFVENGLKQGSTADFSSITIYPKN
jgi:hypothetical protein